MTNEAEKIIPKYHLDNKPFEIDETVWFIINGDMIHRAGDYKSLELEEASGLDGMWFADTGKITRKIIHNGRFAYLVESEVYEGFEVMIYDDSLFRDPNKLAKMLERLMSNQSLKKSQIKLAHAMLCRKAGIDFGENKPEEQTNENN